MTVGACPTTRVPGAREETSCSVVLLPRLSALSLEPQNVSNLLPFVRDSLALFEEQKLVHMASLCTLQGRVRVLLSQIDKIESSYGRECKAALELIRERCQALKEKTLSSRPTYILAPQGSSPSCVLGETSLQDGSLTALQKRVDDEDQAALLLSELTALTTPETGPIPTHLERFEEWSSFFEPHLRHERSLPEKSSKVLQFLYTVSRLNREYKSLYEEWRFVTLLVTKCPIVASQEKDFELTPLSLPVEGKTSLCRLLVGKELAQSSISRIENWIRTERNGMLEILKRSWDSLLPRLKEVTTLVLPHQEQDPLIVKVRVPNGEVEYELLSLFASERLHRINHLRLRVEILRQQILELLSSFHEIEYLQTLSDRMTHLWKEGDELFHVTSDRCKESFQALDERIQVFQKKVQCEEEALNLLLDLSTIAKKTGVSLPQNLYRLDQWVFFLKGVDSQTSSHWPPLFKALCRFSNNVFSSENECSGLFENTKLWFTQSGFKSELFRSFGYEPLLDELFLKARMKLWEGVRSLLPVIIRPLENGQSSWACFYESMKRLPTQEETRGLEEGFCQMRLFHREFVCHEIDGLKLQATSSLRYSRAKQAFMRKLEQLGLKSRTRTRGEIRESDFETETQCLERVATLNVFAAIVEPSQKDSELGLQYERVALPLRKRWLHTYPQVDDLVRATKKGLSQTILLRSIQPFDYGSSLQGNIIEEMRPALDERSPALIQRRVLLLCGRCWPENMDHMSQVSSSLCKKGVASIQKSTKVTYSKLSESQTQWERSSALRMKPFSVTLARYLVTNPFETSLGMRMRFGLMLAKSLDEIHRSGFWVGNLRPCNMLLVSDNDGSLKLKLSQFMDSKPFGERAWLGPPYLAPEYFTACATGNLFPVTPESDMFLCANYLFLLKHNRDLLVESNLAFGQMPMVQSNTCPVSGFPFSPDCIRTVQERFQALSHELEVFSQNGNRDEVDHLLVRMFSLNPQGRPSEGEVIAVLERWLSSH